MAIISENQYLAWQKKLGENKIFRWFWVFCGIYIILAYFCVSLYLLFLHQYKIVLIALVAFVFSRFVICEIVYFFYKRRRPCQRLNFIPPQSRLFISWVNKRFDSFPSGHASSLVAISVACLFFSLPLGVLGLLGAIFNSAGRIVLGYHYVSDIFAGWLVGMFSAFVVIFWFAPLLLAPH